jgi:hypothetical protein
VLTAHFFYVIQNNKQKKYRKFGFKIYVDSLLHSAICITASNNLEIRKYGNYNIHFYLLVSTTNDNLNTLPLVISLFTEI